MTTIVLLIYVLAVEAAMLHEADPSLDRVPDSLAGTCADTQCASVGGSLQEQGAHVSHADGSKAEGAAPVRTVYRFGEGPVVEINPYRAYSVYLNGGRWNVGRVMAHHVQWLAALNHQPSGVLNWLGKPSNPHCVHPPEHPQYDGTTEKDWMCSCEENLCCSMEQLPSGCTWSERFQKEGCCVDIGDPSVPRHWAGSSYTTLLGMCDSECLEDEGAGGVHIGYYAIFLEQMEYRIGDEDETVVVKWGKNHDETNKVHPDAFFVASQGIANKLKAILQEAKPEELLERTKPVE